MDKIECSPEQTALELMLETVTPAAKLAFLLCYAWINGIPFNFCEDGKTFPLVYQLTGSRQRLSADLIWLLRTHSLWLEPVFYHFYTDKPLITRDITLDEWCIPVEQATYAFGVDKDFYNAFEHGSSKEWASWQLVPYIEPDLEELQRLLEEMLPPLYVIQEIEDPFAL